MVDFKSRKFALIAVIGAVVVVLAGGGAFLVLRTKGSPEQAAGDFLDAWRSGDRAAMKEQVAKAPAAFDAAYDQVRTGLGVRAVKPELGKVTESGGTAHAAFRVTLTLNAVGAWTYDGRLDLTDADRQWKVKWTPAAIHPALGAGQRLATSTHWPKRGAILAADGSRMDGPGATGSVQQLTGTLAPATKKDVKRLGAPYKPGDPVGVGGVQQQYETRLAGRPATAITVADASGKPVKTVGRVQGASGTSVRTSLSPKVQRAAAKAIISQGKPTALVAIRPSTGAVLAMANVPGGFNRALEGRYAPGSTFKIVTGTALAKAGVTPSTTVQCPKTINVGGMTVRNSEHESFGAIPFRTAFAKSCNTAFAGTTKAKLDGAKLKAAAQMFGFNAPMNLGLPAVGGRFPNIGDEAELAAASFGQGKVTANPLEMAAVAAAVGDGTWRPPHLVTTPKVAQKAAPHKLPSGVDGQLRSMMRAVVTSGTAADAGLPSGTAGKTGTAEYGTGKKPPTHAWFAAYRGDVAMAVVVEGGGFGGKVAAPIAAKFFKAL